MRDLSIPVRPCSSSFQSPLTMNAEHQPWSIHLQAKAKDFNFKFKTTTFIPACYNFFHFSLFLVNNNNQPTRRKSLKSRVTGFIERFRSIPTKKTTVAAQKLSRIKKLKWGSCEGPICGTTAVVIGNLALLVKSINEKDVKGIIIHCFSILLYIFTLLKTFVRNKNNKLLLVSIILMVGYPLWLYVMNKPTHGRRTFAWRLIWNTLSWAASHGFLNAIAHVI